MKYFLSSVVNFTSITNILVPFEAITSGAGNCVDPDPAALIAAHPCAQNLFTKSLSAFVPLLFLDMFLFLKRFFLNSYLLLKKSLFLFLKIKRIIKKAFFLFLRGVFYG